MVVLLGLGVEVENGYEGLFAFLGFGVGFAAEFQGGIGIIG